MTRQWRIWHSSRRSLSLLCYQGGFASQASAVAGVQRRLDSGVFRTFDGFVGTAGLAEKVHVGGPQGTMAVCRVEDGRVVLESLPDLGITVR